MPVTIGELTTEVVTEADVPTGNARSRPEPSPDVSVVRADLAARALQRLRTRAEGFDD